MFDICEGSENVAVYFSDELLRQKLQKYVCCNIPGPDTDTKPFEEMIDGCTCTEQTCNTSHESACSCVQLSFSSHCDSSVPQELPPLSRLSSVECNSLCTCSQDCDNRLVQKGLRHGMEVFEDPHKGFALRTLSPIKSNAFVCEYAGEILSVAEAKRRFSGQTGRDRNYIFVLNEHFSSGLQTTYVDPRFRGNIGRFLNHSCDPNLFIVPVRVHNFVPKLCLFAKRDVSVGEELTYDYGGLGSSSEPTGSRTGQQIPCHCQSSNCRRYLPFDTSIHCGVA